MTASYLERTRTRAALSAKTSYPKALETAIVRAQVLRCTCRIPSYFHPYPNNFVCNRNSCRCTSSNCHCTSSNRRCTSSNRRCSRNSRLPNTHHSCWNRHSMAAECTHLANTDRANRCTKYSERTPRRLRATSPAALNIAPPPIAYTRGPHRCSSALAHTTPSCSMHSRSPMHTRRPHSQTSDPSLRDCTPCRIGTSFPLERHIQQCFPEDRMD